MGAGWGDPCELCPEKNSKEFQYYCPNGVGLERNNTGMSAIVCYMEDICNCLLFTDFNDMTIIFNHWFHCFIP